MRTQRGKFDVPHHRGMRGAACWPRDSRVVCLSSTGLQVLALLPAIRKQLLGLIAVLRININATDVA